MSKTRIFFFLLIVIAVLANVKHIYGEEKLKGVWVNVRIEGDQDTIAAGRVQANNMLEAVQRLGQELDIEVVLQKNENGMYIASIDKLKEKKYGGFDQWAGFLIRKNTIIEPTDSLSETILESNDEIVFYYGDYGYTKKVPDIAVSYGQNQMVMTIAAQYMIWIQEDTGWVNKQVREALQGIHVHIRDGKAKEEKVFETDEQGRIVVSDMPMGMYSYYLEGYQKDKPPAIVRTTEDIFILGIEKKESITRAEFTALMVRYYNLKKRNGVVARKDFEEHPFFKELEIAVSQGIIHGYADGTFRPDESITFLEAGIILSRVQQQDSAEVSTMEDKDFGDIPAWAQEEIYYGISKGFFDNMKDPWRGPLTIEMLKQIGKNIESSLP